MAQPNPELSVNGALSALERLRKVLKEPLKTSSNFASTLSRKSLHTTPSFRLLAAAPPTGDPTLAVNLENLAKIPKARKRKAGKEPLEGAVVKRKRGPKPKEDATATALAKSKGKRDRKNRAIAKLPDEIWVRIAEFSAPKDYIKIRLVCRAINIALLHWQNQVRQVQILEHFPATMPQKLADLTQQQYNHLLSSGKGCMAPGCKDRKAEKTYWPFARRWCSECYSKLTVKWREVQEKERNTNSAGPHGWTNINLLLTCIPYGIRDSFSKAHNSIVEELPRHRTPKLYRVCESSAADKIIQEWKDFIPKLIERDPNLTDAENNAAKAADARMRAERSEARDVHFKALAEKNKKYMEDVAKIEECIKETKKAAKAEKAANRVEKLAEFSERAANEFPETPLNIILKLQCFQDAVRISTKTTPRMWDILKPKIEKELLENPNPSSTSATTTRSSTPSSGSSESMPSTPFENLHYEFSRQANSTPSSTNLPSAETSRSSTPSRTMIRHSSNISSAQTSSPSTPSMSMGRSSIQRQVFPFSVETSRVSTPHLMPSHDDISVAAHHGLMMRLDHNSQFAPQGPMQDDEDLNQRFHLVRRLFDDNFSNTGGGSMMNASWPAQSSIFQSSFQAPRESSTRPSLPLPRDQRPNFRHPVIQSYHTSSIFPPGPISPFQGRPINHASSCCCLGQFVNGGGHLISCHLRNPNSS